MQVHSIHRYAKISPFKAREVTREIQGLPAVDALAQLKFIPKKAAALIAKTLKSAIANAEHNQGLNPETLVIKEAVIGEAPTLNRIMARARGSASPIRKRTSHIRIVLTDAILPVRRLDAKRKRNKKTTPTTKQLTVQASAQHSDDIISDYAEEKNNLPQIISSQEGGSEQLPHQITASNETITAETAPEVISEVVDE